MRLAVATHPDFGKQIYNAFSGTGKNRLKCDGALRKRRHWCNQIISNGEIPVQQFIEESGGMVRGGQLVRLIDIQAPEYFSSADEIDTLKVACAKYFGTAGPAFIRYVTNIGLETVKNDLGPDIAKVADKLGDAPTPEKQRVRKRFAFYAVMGEMAIASGILSWKTGRVIDACLNIYSKWASSVQARTDAERGIINIRNFIHDHGSSRFEFENDNDVIGLVKNHAQSQRVINRAGWYRNRRFCFTPEAFREGCGGVLDTTVKKSLFNHGLLTFKTGYMDSISVLNTTTHVIAVREEILKFL